MPGHPVSERRAMPDATCRSTRRPGPARGRVVAGG